MKYSALSVGLFWLTRASALVVPQPVHTALTEEDGADYGDYAQLFQRQDDPVAELLTTYASEDIIPTSDVVRVRIATIPTGTLAILPTLSDVEPQTTGVVVTDEGKPSKTPLLTDPIPSPTSLLKPLASTTSSKRDASPTERALAVRQAAPASNVFAVPIGTDGPPSMIPRRSDHPAPRTGAVRSSSGPIHTNKFYANLLLGERTAPAYTLPYAISWAKGTGATASYGISISHVESKQWDYGPVEYNRAVKYYINPVGIQSMVLSARELGKDTTMSVDSMTQFYARILLRRNAAASPTIYFPIVQGMPFVTARYAAGTPQIQSGVYIRTMTKVGTDPKSNVRKYTFLLEDGTTWRLYAWRTAGEHLDLQVLNNGLAQSRKVFTGVIQIAKDPKTTGSERLLDDGAGVYPTGGVLTGSMSGNTGTYKITYTRNGHPSGNLYMYALPHHVASFDAATRGGLQSAMRLQTPTKGMATLVRGTSWTMIETGIPLAMNFAPWDNGPKRTLSAAAKAAIRPIALSEISQNMMEQTNLNSMYFSGKALYKFAQLVYLFDQILGDKALAQAGLVKLKEAFAVFAQNKQEYPLVYESAWGGLVSSASYVTGNKLDDFGNTYYNDHHFHYGYHILAASVIAFMDKNWAAQNKAYVNSMVRDIANPVFSDKFYPQHRNFDWYHGHSWAHGLYESLDGKNQESSSEDMMAVFAVRQWGTHIGDANMVARANIQMAVLRRSLQSYYLYTSDNKIMPSNFIGNKVAGVLFENKVDHTTFFSPDIEAIQGIHMIPVHAPSAYARSKTFIKQEWDAYFSNGRVDKYDNAWKSVIYANFAAVEPKRAWDYFRSDSFKPEWIDGGASRAWYMVYAATLGGL